MAWRVAADLTAAGKKGVVTNALYDFWAPARQYMAYHAGVRILSEAASASLATPLTVRPDQIQTTGLGYNPRERSWNYLEPWEGGTWRIGDIVDYQLIAFESLLYQAAIRRVDLLRNFYEVGERAVARKSPYAFVISRAQMDPGSARKMLELLSFGDVEIERASDAFVAGGKRYAEGSYIVRMQQPYSSYAKTLLERQHYPDLRSYPGGPPQRPYDVTAQTLPLLMGVETDTVDAPFSRVVQSEPVNPRSISSLDGNACRVETSTSGAPQRKLRASRSTRATCPPSTKAGRAGCSKTSASLIRMC